MAALSLAPTSSFTSLNSNNSNYYTLHFYIPASNLHRLRTNPPRKFRVFCEFQTEELERRKFTASVEKESPSINGTAGVLDSDEWRAVPDIWRFSAEKYGDRTALVDPYHDPPTKMTYKQLEQEVLEFSEGLRAIGVQAHEKVALFADNSSRWLVADQGIMAVGAIDVVRGSRSSLDELLQIYNHSESVGLAVDSPEFFNRISETFCLEAALRFVILLWGERPRLVADWMENVPVFSYNEIIEFGRENLLALSDLQHARQLQRYEPTSSDEIATIVYTSGTTGSPKGVMLSHKNLLHQVKYLSELVCTEAGDRFLSMLPPWHVYERACEYFLLTHGIEQIYTTVKTLKVDLQHYQPQYLISVPLVYDTLYKGILKQINSSSFVRKYIALTLIRISLLYMEFKRIYEGACLTNNPKEPSYILSVLDWFSARVIASALRPLHLLAKQLIYSKINASLGITKAAVCGGGHLPLHVDKFFEAVGVKIHNGYGLTESSPVVACRRYDNNVLGTVGPPLRYTEFKIVDTETGKPVSPGCKGIVKVKGPQVMKGYYKNSVATEQALDKEGWLNTGDLGWIVPQHSRGRIRRSGGMIVLEGRNKDTIVLSTGENVEPLQLEEVAMRSSLIQQIVVFGQDQRRLGAVIVPNKDEVLQAAKKSSTVGVDATYISRDKMTSLIYEELRTWTSGLSFQIGPLLVVDEPFTIENGLMTPTMKIRRDSVVAKYKKDIDTLYN